MLENPFILGTISVIVTGAAMGVLYKFPPLAWRFLRNRFVMTVDVDNVDPCYRWLKAYIGHVASARWLVAGTLPSPDSVDGSTWSPRSKPLFYLAPRGVSRFRFRGRWFVAWVEKQPLQHSVDFRETISLQCWRGRGNAGAEAVRALLEEARVFAVNQGGRRVEIWMPSGADWSVADRKLPRPESSLVLADGVLGRVIDDARQFLAAREWYGQMGIPWRRSYLLHGPPGNGKSSLVHVLASEVGAHVNVANLSHFENDQQMVACLSRVPAGNILLLEDIDSAFDGRNARAGTRVSFAALLNCLDGMTAQDGRIVVMSTNHVDKLDPALVRPGRADVRVLLDNATSAQAAEMYRRFLPDATGEAAAAFGAAHERQSMAKIQEQLLRRRDGEDECTAPPPEYHAAAITEPSLAA